MSKKIKIIILVVTILAVIALVMNTVIKRYNQREHIIVSKAFGFNINKDADLIYFDEDTEYLHAAYGVSTEDYNILKEEIKSAGYQEMNFDKSSVNYEWIPSDRLAIMYRLVVYGENPQDVYITEAENGIVELYFVK